MEWNGVGWDGMVSYIIRGKEEETELILPVRTHPGIATFSLARKFKPDQTYPKDVGYRSGG